MWASQGFRGVLFATAPVYIKFATATVVDKHTCMLAGRPRQMSFPTRRHTYMHASCIMKGAKQCYLEQEMTVMMERKTRMLWFFSSVKYLYYII